MAKLVIVEGPDGAGKSTLIQNLMALGGFISIHTGGPPRDKQDLEDKLDKIKLALDVAGNHILILDRHPAVSDPIYSKVTGSRSFATPGWLGKQVWSLDPVFVYCRGSADSMRENISKSPKAHKSPEHLLKVIQNHGEIVKLYDAFFALAPNIRYDWQRDSVLELAKVLRGKGGQGCVAL